MRARRRPGDLEPRMRFPTVFETRGFLLSVVTSLQRKQPWMKQVDSTFLQIRPHKQEPHNRTCIRKRSKRSVSWSGSLGMTYSRVSGQYSSAAKVCSVLSLMQEKKPTTSFSRADKLKWLLQGWPALSAAVSHPCTFKRNCSLEYNSFQAGFLLNGMVSSKPREVSKDLTRWILEKGFLTHQYN